MFLKRLQIYSQWLQHVCNLISTVKSFWVLLKDSALVNTSELIYNLRQSPGRSRVFETLWQKAGFNEFRARRRRRRKNFSSRYSSKKLQLAEKINDTFKIWRPDVAAGVTLKIFSPFSFFSLFSTFSLDYEGMNDRVKATLFHLVTLTALFCWFHQFLGWTNPKIAALASAAAFVLSF